MERPDADDHGREAHVHARRAVPPRVPRWWRPHPSETLVARPDPSWPWPYSGGSSDAGASFRAFEDSHVIHPLTRVIDTFSRAGLCHDRSSEGSRGHAPTRVLPSDGGGGALAATSPRAVAGQ